MSPLIGAIFLHKVDTEMERLGLFYIRFMDDVLVLAPTRWRLRAAVKTVNRLLGALDLEKHPDKTFMGRIERGFDFLGYHFTRARLSLATKTIQNFIEKASRLYEQESRAGFASTALEMYVKRWVRWTMSDRLNRSDRVGFMASCA